MKKTLTAVFEKLNMAIETENRIRRAAASLTIPISEIIILGQSSLLVQPELTFGLSLAQTGDLDAKLKAENFVKIQLKAILPTYGLLFDEDGPLIFIPKGSRFSPFLDLQWLRVKVIDPESALVSKAVKAPDKNRQLLRQAIASLKYPNLVPRIVDAGGDLNNFK